MNCRFMVVTIVVQVTTGLIVSLEEDGLVHLVLACHRRCPLYMLLVTVATDVLQPRYSQGDFKKL